MNPLRPSLQHSTFSIQHFLLLLLALCPYFIDLGGSSIWDANEAFYVETPREMMERGDYIFPTFNYEPRVNKPVLSYWIVAAFYQVFGVSEGVQRIPIAVGGLVLIAIAFFLARAAAPDGLGPAAAYWAAAGMAVSPRLVMFARRIFIDIYISMFMALTLLFFALSERYPEKRRLFLTLMYVAAALGVLTKGPVAVVLPGLAIVAYLFVYGELRRIREMLLLRGLLIGLAIVLPWYVALYWQAGWKPIWSFIVGENLRRYTEGEGVNAERGIFFYVPVVISDAFPWSLFLFAAAVTWLRERRRAMIARDPVFRVQTLLWLWIVTIVGFFSLSAGKQDLYIFPTVPAIVALGGVVIARGLRSATERETNAVRLTTMILGGLLTLTGVVVVLLFTSSEAVYVLAGAALAGTVGVAGGIIAVMLAARRQLSLALTTVVVALVAVNWIFVVRILPTFEAYKPSPRFAEILKVRAAPKDHIVTFNVALPSLVYYLRRHTDVFYDHEPVIDMFGKGGNIYLMLPRHDYETLVKPALKVQTCVVSSEPTFDVKLRSVLSREPLPRILLVTNVCSR